MHPNDNYDHEGDDDDGKNYYDDEMKII